MNIIHVTLIVSLITNNVFPKTSLPNATFPLLPAPLKVSHLWEFVLQIVL